MNDYDDNPDLSEGAMAYLNGNAQKQKLHEEENARRLARYDEMFSLLKEAANDGWFSNKDLHDRLQAFLAAEGKVAG